ncbi:MAG TPA: MoaD/ThiS family protein [Thermoproteota archaeon]|nr:MoaD/ThiS family protein [Thermoproteota archaeon]
MAIKIEVEFIGLLREITGEHHLTLDMEDGATLKDVIEKLGEKYGKDLAARILEGNGISDDALVIINGRSIRTTDVNSIVMRNGDTLALAPESAP